MKEVGNGKEWEIVSRPEAAVSNIPEAARTQLSLPHCPRATGLAGVSCLKAKRAQGLPVGKSLERRGLSVLLGWRLGFSFAAVSHVLPSPS